MMRALLGKDWRVNRVAVVGGVAATACPYAVMFAMQAVYPPAGGNTRRTYLLATENAAEIAMLLTLVMAAVFGGMAFAAERRERSDEFVAMLPVTRWPIVLSKLFVGVTGTAVLAGVNGTVLLYARAASSVPTAVAAGILAALVVLYFAAAWALSLYVRSPAVAAAVATGFATAVYIGLTSWAKWAETARPSSPEAAGTRFAVVCLVIGLLAFAGSTAHYLRRVRP